jgi:threonylcarbamoyladenosine tRNA methylthiotransferase MtaB
MRRLGSQKQRLFLSRWVGKEVEVLVESSRDRNTGKLKGVSSQYATVLLEGGDDLKNRMLRVHVDAVTEDLRLTASVRSS